MSISDSEREDTMIYKVLMNDEEQYFIWPSHNKTPKGCKETGKVGPKADCLAYVKEVWTDMTPLSLRRKMQEYRKNPPPPARKTPKKEKEKGLPDRLSEGDHPVLLSIREDNRLKLLQEAIARNYVHIKFVDTKGGTELGVQLDLNSCNFSRGDFQKGIGILHFEGELELDYVKVRCIADIDLESFQGKGHLIKMASNSPTIN